MPGSCAPASAAIRRHTSQNSNNKPSDSKLCRPSFFMRLEGLNVLLRMLWSDRDVPESQTLEQRADATLAQHDAEPPLDARRKILAAPPDHAVLREIGPGTNPGRHFRLLLSRELRDAARRL